MENLKLQRNYKELHKSMEHIDIEGFAMTKGLIITLMFLLLGTCDVHALIQDIAYLISIAVGITTFLINVPKLKSRLKDIFKNKVTNGKPKSNSR
jgi:hypothetical protein